MRHQQSKNITENKTKNYLNFLLWIALGVSMAIAINAFTKSQLWTEKQVNRTVGTLIEQRDELLIQQQILKSEIRKQEDIVEQYDTEVAKNNQTAARLQEEKIKISMFAGIEAVSGPGVQIILDDRKMDDWLENNSQQISNYIVHDSDVLHVINELKMAGAEAIAVNGTRIVANSRISCGGPLISVGEKDRFAPPFIITAIGDQNKMYKQFKQSESIANIFALFQLEFSISKQSDIVIPGYIGQIEYIYSKKSER